MSHLGPRPGLSRANFATLLVLVSFALLCQPSGFAQDRAAWMKQARWGVMTHYLADWLASTSGEPMTVEKWNALVDGFDTEALADGAQIHMLSFLGQQWGRGTPRFTTEQ